jgi:hypothetical protein
MSVVRDTLRPIALVLALGACTEFNATGYYQEEAEAECRTRGLQPGTAAFTACVNDVTSAEYRRWSRGAPGH